MVYFGKDAKNGEEPIARPKATVFHTGFARAPGEDFPRAAKLIWGLRSKLLSPRILLVFVLEPLSFQRLDVPSGRLVQQFSGHAHDPDHDVPPGQVRRERKRQIDDPSPGRTTRD
jgi:hypothetical protein